jgi:hypothetical protein
LFKILKEIICVDLHSDKQLIKDLENALGKARKNKVCLYPACSNLPIGSHIIARKILRLIAEKGHVLTWLPHHISAWDMQKALDEDIPLERLYEEPVSIGIGDVKKVTTPLFCHYHDESIFRPIEKTDFSFQPEQVLLLAYRALSSISFSRWKASAMDEVIKIAKKHDHSHGLSEPKRYARWQRFLAKDEVWEVYRQHEQLRAAHDYSKLGYSTYLVNIPPCIAATYGFIPTSGNDAQDIVNGTQAVTSKDFMSFTFLPHETLNQSICVISWLRGSLRAQQFLLESRINELSEKEQQDLFFSLFFAAHTIYISPTWWHSLSEEKREEYKKTRLNRGKKYAALI